MKSVGINGYGTIGKRVADAVSAQDDMKIIGVTKQNPDFKARMAVEKCYDHYISVPERESSFEAFTDIYNHFEVKKGKTPSKQNSAKFVLQGKTGAPQSSESNRVKEDSKSSKNITQTYVEEEQSLGKRIKITIEFLT